MNTISLRDRARHRNLRAAVVSAGLVALASLCTALLVSDFSFGSSGATKSDAPRPVAVTARRPAATRPTVKLTTSTASTSTASTSTSTTATTVPPPTTTVAVPTTVPAPVPTAPPVVPTTVTTALPVVTASATVSDKPRFCTVTVRLSTGVQGVYALDAYVANVGDDYVFTATLGGYQVDVEAKVVATANKPKCVATLSHLVHM